MFANPIGVDDDQLKNGCSVIIDPFCDVVAECRKMGNDVVSTVLFPEKLTLAEDIATPRHDGPNCIETLLGRITNQNKK